MPNKTLDNLNNETWFNSKWRPAMAWMYFVVCIFDFIIFPILWSILQAAQNGNVTSQWGPLTVINGGLFHLAMGAVLGITAWSRGREKIADMESRQLNQTETGSEKNG